MQQVVIAFFMLGILMILFYSPRQLCLGIRQIEFGKLTKKDKVTAWLPVYNVASAERLYTGKVSSVLIITLVFMISVVCRFLVIFKFTENVPLNWVTMLLCVISLVAWFAGNMVFVFRILNDSDCVGFVRKLVYSTLFPLGQNFIGNYLPGMLASTLKEESTF